MTDRSAGADYPPGGPVGAASLGRGRGGARAANNHAWMRSPPMAAPIATHGDTMDCLIQVCFCFDVVDRSGPAATTAARTATGHAQ